MVFFILIYFFDYYGILWMRMWQRSDWDGWRFLFFSCSFGSYNCRDAENGHGC